ncbi:MAG: hypothetical protein GVY13_00925, partial [Alphaproteobacteria bacterium]|nr:hypothetical protein [Alphaproteobacteria bacterium]
MNTTADALIKIRPDELDALLDRAEAEQWRTLALYSSKLPHRAVHAECKFQLSGPVDGASLASKLTRLAALTSLALLDFDIGPDGARALSTLTGLTALDLSFNRIGGEGARAISILTGLTALYLSDNGLGDEGARAISTLTGLTSLDLSLNRIGDEGARAISILTG